MSGRALAGAARRPTRSPSTPDQVLNMEYVML
jgi:hypothetical protein